jgi:hypothetical protein
MKADPKWLHGKDRKAAIALMKIYGDDTDAILNGLHAISARIAIGAGCTPDVFAAGVKHHWDFIIEGITSMSPDLRN